MKKIILFSALACCVAFFYACSKDSTPADTATEEPADTIDPVALSATVKVGYATSVIGDIPAASTDGPTLLTEGYDKRVYTAINNRYIVIYPQSDKGYVAGYYIKINGAGSYFKIDYSKASGLRKAAHHHGLREDGDHADSSIVIKLPAGLKGDTFSVKYAAYDSLNRVSNALTAVINLVAPDSASNSLLAGTWRFNRYKDNDEEWSSPQAYGVDSSRQDYTCNDGLLEPGCSTESCMNIAWQLYGETAQDISFAANNQYSERHARVDDILDTESSSCSNLVYDKGRGFDDTFIGGYSYNAKTKMLLIIYDGNGGKYEGTNISTSTYTVSELSSSRIVYYSKYINNEGTSMSFEYSEFLKQ